MKKIYHRFASVILNILLLALAVAAAPAKAVTFEVLHDFGLPDGTTNGADGRPTGGIAVTPDGSIYGVSLRVTLFQRKTVFKDFLWRKSASRFEVLYEFPWGGSSASLVSDAEGRVYGTSANSTAKDKGSPGVAWCFDPVNGMKFLTFGADAGSVNPAGGLVQDSQGYFYGSTDGDSTSSPGAIYRIDPAFTTITTLRPWGDMGVEGRGAYSALEWVDGRLFGTNRDGGVNLRGTAFSVRTDGTDFQVGGFEQGYSPTSGVTYDGSAHFWGATRRSNNTGLIYTIDLAERYHVEERSLSGMPTKVYYKFLRGQDEMLYNVSHTGPRGKFTGQVFQVNPSSGVITTVHAFRADHRDGQRPIGPVVQDASGALYGVTSHGGAYDTGVLYKISP